MNVKAVAGDLANGQAGAVDGDIAFREHILHPALRHLEPQGYVVLCAEDLSQNRSGVHVAAEQVAANLVTNTGCPLKVD